MRSVLTLLLPVLGGLCGLISATWAVHSLYGPWRRSREQEAAMHAAIVGVEEIRDPSGAVIRPGQMGVLARLAEQDRRIEQLISRTASPILNGAGTDLIRTVDRLDRRTARQGKEIREIRGAILADKTPAQREAQR